MNPPPPPTVSKPVPPPPPSVGRKSILRLTDTEERSTATSPEDDSRLPLPEGSQLGDYTIGARLGQGGFGITYRAVDRRTGEQVVVKEHMPVGLAVREPGSLFITAPTPQQEEHFQATLQEFIEEVTILMGLENPGVVRILAAFEANGTAYYVMPYIEGRSLAGVARASLDREERAREARRIKQQLISLLSTLEYMGQNNVVHRDIKPENILLTPEGRPILLDFGSARQRHGGKVFSNIFTPDFCAPEQSTAATDEEMSEAIGPWTDIYSLGATFYYLITRMLPPHAEMRAHAGRDPYTHLASRRDLEDLYGKAFLRALDRALALAPTERWSSAGEWRASIEQGILPPTVAGLRRTRIILGTAIAGLVILGGVSLWALRERSQAMQMYRNSLGFTENVLYDFYDDLADIPGSTQLQRQLSRHLGEYLANMERLPIGHDEKVKRALVVVLLDIGRVNVELGDLDTATDALQRATELELELCREHPENQRYRYDLARTWLNRAEVARRRNHNDVVQQYIEEAMTMLRQLLKDSPTNPDYACSMGVALGYKSDQEGLAGKRSNQKQALDDMLSLYRALSEKYPQHEDARRGLAYALQLHAAFAAEQNDFDHAQAYLQECRDLFNVLAQEHPYKLSVREGLARTIHQAGELYVRMGEHTPELQAKCDEMAMEAFRRHLSLASELEKLDDHNAAYPLQTAKALASMVELELRRGQVNQAEATANALMRKTDTLLATAQDNADYLQLRAAAWRGLAAAHSRSSRAAGRAEGEFTQSRELLESLLAQAPDSAKLRWSYVNTLAETAAHFCRMGDTAQASQWQKRAVEEQQKLVQAVPGNKVYAARLKTLLHDCSSLQATLQAPAAEPPPAPPQS